MTIYSLKALKFVYQIASDINYNLTYKWWFSSNTTKLNIFEEQQCGGELREMPEYIVLKMSQSKTNWMKPEKNVATQLLVENGKIRKSSLVL